MCSGAFLLFTGVKMAGEEDESGIGENRWVGCAGICAAVDRERALFVRKTACQHATPLLLVLIMVEFSDDLHVDSIPAIFAVTTDPFIVLTSNLFTPS